MILNCVKLGQTVIFIKYMASLVSLIFPPKTLIWKEMVVATSNSLKVLELVENELKKEKWPTNLWKGLKVDSTFKI